MDFELEAKIKDLLRDTLSKKGAKHVRSLLDDIMNERPLDIDGDIKKELEPYSTDTLRLIVEKNILLSIENGALANRKSYWEVLKSRAPRIKAGIMAHYYDNYINDLKQEKVLTYHARTIDELNETYGKAINDSIASISTEAMGIVDSVTNISINDANDLRINGVTKGKFKLLRTQKLTGKFVKKDEFVNILNYLEKVPNSSSFLTNKNISVNNLKVIIDSLEKNLNVEEDVVTIGQAGITKVGKTKLKGTKLPNGVYVSIDELNVALNKFINKPSEEKKPAKVVDIRKKIRFKTRKCAAMVAMTVALLSSAIPALKKNFNNQTTAITQEIDNNNLANGITELPEAALEVETSVPDEVPVATVEDNAEEISVESAIPEEAVSEEAPVAETPVVEAPIVENPSVETPVEETTNDDNVNTEEVSGGVEEVKEETQEEPTEEIIEEKEEVQEKIATPEDFNFRFPESNVVAAAARNRGFSDDQIKIAVAISREETGNYTSPAFNNKHNYGGMTANSGERMRFASSEEGLDRFLSMLETGYFGIGLNTIDAIAYKYDKAEYVKWANEVRGCMEKNGIVAKNETEEVKEEQPVEEDAIIVADAGTNEEKVEVDEVKAEVASEEKEVEEKVEMVAENKSEDIETNRTTIEIKPAEEKEDSKTEEVEEEKTESNEEKAPVENKEEEKEEVKEVEETKEEEKEEESKDSTEEKAEVDEPIKEVNVLDKIPTAEKEKMNELGQASTEEITTVEAPMDEEEKIEVKEEKKEEPKAAPAVETPIIETPVVETPIIETPVVETPVVETQVVETPVVEAPVVEAPVVAPAGDAAAALGLSPEQLDVVKATIRHEAGANLAEIANVASCVKNRMNSGGANAYSVITAAGQFESYEKNRYKPFTGGNYIEGDPVSSAQASAIIDSILLGTTPPTHGFSSFRGPSSPIGTQFTDGGNKYR